jgi:hypothetical protein
METEPVEEQGYIGSYQLSVVPDRFRTALIYVHDIVAAGHSVTFNQHNTHLQKRRCLYTPHTPGSHLQRMTRATHCARTTNATTFNAPNPPTAAYPHKDAPQLTAGQHIQERMTTRTRTKHRFPRRSPPRPHRARTRRSALPSRELYLAQHGSDTVRHTPSLLSSTMPRLCPCQAQQGQQTNLVKTTTGPTTATPSRHTLTNAERHQNRIFNGRNPTGTKGGQTLGDQRMHQLR